MGGTNSVPLQQRLSDAASSANQATLAAAQGLNTGAQTLGTVHSAAKNFGAQAQALGQSGQTAYGIAKQGIAGSGFYGGGAGAQGAGFFGGGTEASDLEAGAEPIRELREYEDSIAAKTKESTVRRLAAAMKLAGISVDPEGDLDGIVQALVSQIPDPRKGKTFASDAKSQEKVCRAVADALNNTFNPGATKAADKFIDTSLGAASVCRQVGEWVHSYVSGVAAEFAEVHASVRRVLRNIEVLEEVMDRVHDEIMARVPDAHKTGVSLQIGSFDEAFRAAKSLRKQQEELLKNYLHVTLAPAQKELEIAMRDESEAHRLIRKIGLQPGTLEFADTLALAVSGIGTVAAVAQKVHKALKAVGLSVTQYLDSADMQALNALVDEKMMASGKGAPADLGKFLEAVQELRRNFDRRAELKPGFAELGGRSGGADDDDGRSDVTRRVDKLKAEKTLLVRDFAARTKVIYAELQAATKALSTGFGKEIPISDRTDVLRDALQRLQDQTRAGGSLMKIEVSLVGLATDMASRELKERFQTALRFVSSTLSSLMELEFYRSAAPLFGQLKSGIDRLDQLIGHFSDIVVKRYGGGEAVYGGDAGDYMAEAASSSLNLHEAIASFIYMYYIAKVRSNLAQTSKELESYGEKYTDLLAEAVAARLRALAGERRVIEALLNKQAGAGPPYHKYAPGGAAASAENLEAYKAFVAREYATKAKFYNVVQAVDLYMKAFTDAIAKDPDSVRDIKKILDGAQVITRWFSEETGENLWKAFECMPALTAGGINTARVAATNPVANNGADLHYYEKVRGARASEGPPRADVAEVGLPQASRPLASPEYKAAEKHVGAMYDSFQGLKNLINAFARIGDKFGGKDLRSQIFMTPTQIFKALMDYIKASAFSVHRQASGEDPADALRLTSTSEAAANPTNNSLNAALSQEAFFSSTFQFIVDRAGGGAPDELSDFRGNWQVEDRYFQLILKSMASKILTVLGVYDMLERESPLNTLTPTRMIVGGANQAEPEAIAEAAELYFRLPRLAEFYRGFLRWDGEGPAVGQRIAMLPELEGTFSGLIRLVFQKFVSPESGDYSDDEVKAIIREVNVIYDAHSGKGGVSATTGALNGLVREINRRYGVIKSADMKAYWNMVNEDRALLRTSGAPNVTDYAILPGEGDFEADRRAPSDRFARGGPTGLDQPEAAPKHAIDITDWSAAAPTSDHYVRLREFRLNLDKEFAGVEVGRYSQSTFGAFIRQTALEIERASTKEAKLALAIKLVQGVGSAGIDANKALMFHETVTVGLNMLSAIQTLLVNFEHKIEELDLCRLSTEVRYSLLKENVAVTVARVQNSISDTYTDGTIGRRARAILNISDGNLLTRAGAALNATTADVITFLNNERVVLAGAAAPAADMAAYVAGIPAGGGGHDAIVRFEAVFAVTSRLIFNYNQVMRDLIENIFALTGGGRGLIDLRFPGTAELQLQFDFSKLASYCESVLAEVKGYIDSARPFLSAAAIERFERMNHRGSSAWLEENLITRFFRPITSADDRNRSVSALSRKVNRLFLYLIRDTYAADPVDPPSNEPDAPRRQEVWKEAVAFSKNLAAVRLVDNAGLVSGNAGLRAAVIRAPPDGNLTRYETYGRALSHIAWYDIANARFAAEASEGLTTAGLQNLIATGPPVAGALQPPRVGAPAAVAAGAPTRANLYAPAQGVHRRQKSLMVAFNQLVSKYLVTLSDKAGGGKIYLNLVNAFANGVASRAVSAPNEYAYPDLYNAAAATPFGHRGDPIPTAFLFQSLAYILQRIIKDANPTTSIPLHLVATLSDVPLYMKETYKAELPLFGKLFESLAAKCDFIKQFVQKTTTSGEVKLRLDRASAVDLATGAGAAGGVAGTTMIQYAMGGGFVNVGGGGFTGPLTHTLYPIDAGQTDVDMKARIVAFCDAISSASYVLSSAASEVRKELADAPVFCQVQENSVDTYKSRYGKLPLMPLSLALSFLRGPDGPDDDPRLLPDHAPGDPQFKLLYGVRGLLVGGGGVTYDQIPGAKALLDTYNGASATRDQIDPERYLGFSLKIIELERFALESRNFRAVLSTSIGPDRLYSTRLLTGDGTGITTGPDGTAGYALAATDQDVLAVVENSNQDDQIRKIVERVGGPAGASATNRKEERLFNLIDMNIVPINIHALMRSIPLVNLFNYSYTFEQYACSIFGEDSEKVSKLSETTTANTRQMFLRLILDPYAPVTLDAYGSDMVAAGTGGYIHRIFRGDNNLGMGRPKFLSDQVFSKALFGSIYPSQADFDEAGPPAGSAVARGRDRVGVARAFQRAITAATTIQTEMTTMYNDLLAAANPAVFVANAAVLLAANAGGPGIDELRFIAQGRAAAGANAAARDVNALFAAWDTDVDALTAGNDAVAAAAAAAMAPAPVPVATLTMLRGLVGAPGDAAAIAALAAANPVITLASMRASVAAIDARMRRAAAVIYGARLARMRTWSARMKQDVVDVVGALPLPANTEALLAAVQANAATHTSILYLVDQVDQIDALGADPAIRAANGGFMAIHTEFMARALPAAGPGMGLSLQDLLAPAPPAAGAVAGSLPAVLVPVVAPGAARPPGHAIPAALGAPPALGAIWRQQAPPLIEGDRQSRNHALTYLAPSSPNDATEEAVRLVDVGVDAKRNYEIAGLYRWNTRIVRNLFFITNLVRLIRLKLGRELTQNRHVIARSHEAIATDLTEYGLGADGPNETIHARQYDDGQQPY